MVKETTQTVYNCDYCEKQYFKQKTCINHENKCEKTFNSYIAIIDMINQQDYVRNNVRSISEIPEMVEDRIKKIANVSISVKLTDVSYHYFLSNSHYCPIGKVTNFSRVSDKPQGFTGFKGTIQVYIDGDDEKENKQSEQNLLNIRELGFSGFVSDFIRSRNELPYFYNIPDVDNEKIQNYIKKCENQNVWTERYQSGSFFRGLQTGAGGGNNAQYSCEIYMFLDDFPLILQEWKKLKLYVNSDVTHEQLCQEYLT